MDAEHKILISRTLWIGQPNCFCFSRYEQITLLVAAWACNPAIYKEFFPRIFGAKYGYWWRGLFGHCWVKPSMIECVYHGVGCFTPGDQATHVTVSWLVSHQGNTHISTLASSHTFWLQNLSVANQQKIVFLSFAVTTPQERTHMNFTYLLIICLLVDILDFSRHQFPRLGVLR